MRCRLYTSCLRSRIDNLHWNYLYGLFRINYGYKKLFRLERSESKLKRTNFQKNPFAYNSRKDFLFVKILRQAQDDSAKQNQLSTP